MLESFKKAFNSPAVDSSLSKFSSFEIIKRFVSTFVLMSFLTALPETAAPVHGRLLKSTTDSFT